MPLKFEIYANGDRLNAFDPVSATAVGPESVPWPGEVTFVDNLLTVECKEQHAYGVSLLWDCGRLGRFQLETTRLPQRDKPYVLNVELARFRLMRLMQKQEDWNLFDFPKAERFTQTFQQAQNLFAEALGKLDEPPEAAKLADQALDIGIELAEQLAAFHGELLIGRRRSANSFVKHIFGCRIDPTIQSEKYKETLSGSFDYAVLPFNWKQIQPQEQSFELGPIDEWVEMLTRKRVPTIAGPLIRFDPANVPDWMVIWEHDFDMLRDMAHDYVQRVVSRYRRVVGVWNVAAGLQTNMAFTLSFEQIIELTRLLVSQVKSVLPSAKTLVTISYPFGEYHAAIRGSVPPLLYAEMIAQSGVNFEAFGLELEMGVPEKGRFTRDLFQISSMLDKFATLGRPVFLTGVCVPARATPDMGDRSEGKLDPSDAGMWHRPWDPELQAEWMDAVYHLALSKPFIESIAWSNLADLSQTLPGGGLMDDMFRPKPAFTKLQQLREKFKQFQRK